MEITRKEYDTVFNRTKFDEIPSNWYVSARAMYNLTAWCLYHWSQGHTLRGEIKGADKMLYDTWKYIEEHAFAYGKENENED